MSKPSHGPEIDFAADGIDILTAMIRHARAHPDRANRPKHILWNGVAVWTSFDISAPHEGQLGLEFLSVARTPPQGVDMRAEDGAFTLAGGERVQVLRTWHDAKYEKTVQYPFATNVGSLKIWNVYHRAWPDGRVTEEKWTGNAGMTVEQLAESCWVFRCSSGPVPLPDFDQLVFRLTINPGHS